MWKWSRSWQVLAVVGSLACSAHARADLFAELDAPQQEEVKKGEMVVLTENIDGKPWPRVKVYGLVNATPEEVSAIFFDYDKAKLFIPNLLKSQVCNKVSPCTMDIDYGLDIPILPDEYYTMRNTLKVDGSQYSFSWKLLRALQTKDSVGGFRIEPFEGKAVYCYQNLVTPGSGMAVLLRGKAISQLKETVEAIIQHVEKEKSTNPAGLQKEVESLREALKTP